MWSLDEESAARLAIFPYPNVKETYTMDLNWMTVGAVAGVLQSFFRFIFYVVAIVVSADYVFTFE
jgi:hypothetical protein